MNTLVLIFACKFPIPGLALTLYLRQDGDDAQSNTNQHIERDEEFVQLALSRVVSNVVKVVQDDCSQ